MTCRLALAMSPWRCRIGSKRPRGVAGRSFKTPRQHSRDVPLVIQHSQRKVPLIRQQHRHLIRPRTLRRQAYRWPGPWRTSTRVRPNLMSYKHAAVLSRTSLGTLTGHLSPLLHPCAAVVPQWQLPTSTDLYNATFMLWLCLIVGSETLDCSNQPRCSDSVGCGTQ